MRWLLAVLLVLLPAGCSEAETMLPPITRADATAAAPTAPDSSEPATTVAPSTTVAPAPPLGGTTADRFDERAEMVEMQIVDRGLTHDVVVPAMLEVPRHQFVPARYLEYAYGDHPLPIGYGQTISQPFIVAIMSAALEVTPGDTVLEIGTGSGYQAAVLAAMGMEVYSIEIIPELAAGASAVLDELGYEVTVRTADGYFGWEEHAPFDGIIVTAAPDHVPQPLLDQLAPGGTLVIPVGPVGAVQTLWRFMVDDAGEVTAESLGPVGFVPFTRADDG